VHYHDIEVGLDYAPEPGWRTTAIWNWIWERS
jgi:hypothetical protein